MQFSGTVEIAAPRARVWALLMDFEQLGTCGPGVESVTRQDETHATVRAKVGIGFITAGFTIDLELTEAVEPDRAVVVARGDAPGNQVEATGRMELSGPPQGPTTMAWTADVDIFGALAGLGSRMIEGTASKLIDDTFECIRAKLATA
jgi:carbon monoxide dehydrogenase subunit G